LPSRKAEALLAVLARLPGKKYSREMLASLLWPESQPSKARSSLRQTLKHLRQLLAIPNRESIVVGDDTLAIEPALFEVDVARFEELSKGGARSALEKAVDLYEGDFLEGFVDPTEPFSEWVMFERMRLRERIAIVLEKLLQDDLSDGRTAHSIQRAGGLLALDPLDERMHRLLMRLYLEQDRRSAALEQYRLCCAVLQQKLGVRPDRQTEALYREILQRNHPNPSDKQPQAALEAILSRPAVAVLPFTNLNGDPAQTYFSDGVSEDIITLLAGWRRFPLIASSSSLTYRDRSKDIRRIADELGAGYLVTGSVRHAGKRARINARLIESQSGYVHWTKRYDLDFSDILEAQEDIAERIAAAIEPALEHAELGRIATIRTDDVSAWDYFLRGTSFLHRYTLESNAQAQRSFQQAIELDHGYSDAYTGLALSYLRNLLIKSPGSSGKGGACDHGKQLALAFDAARKAVALDPNSSDAHLQVGTAYVWLEDLDSAISETELAVELNPSNAHARMALGNRLDLIGRNVEGIEQMKHSLELNPRDLNRWNYMGYLSRACIDSRQSDEALYWAKKALQLRPDQPEAHFRVAVCLAHLGQILETQAALAECERLCPGFVAMKASWKPYADMERNENYFSGLRRLSLCG
jgi:DNA-binding SARP family transcriptional activator/Flp pilus assembly protein TadD